MHVLLATGLYPPEIGGPATHATILEGELPKFGITVETLAFGTVRKYPKLIRHALYLFALLRRGQAADIIYALDPVSVGLPALIASRILGKKFVLRVAGDYAWEQASSRFGVDMVLDTFVHEVHTMPLPVRIMAAIERRVAEGALRIIVPSEYLKHIVKTWGVEEKKISVVYTAFTPLEVTQGRDEIRSMLGYNGPTIVSVGRLVPWKGFRTLIDVVAELVPDHPTIQCVIIGDGPERAGLGAHAREAGVADRVRFVDRQPKETLAVAISGADIFVLNTGYEGFSHQLLEVMSLGIPIVTTPVGGNTELLRDKKDALLVPHDDRAALGTAIATLIANSTMGASLAGAARERVMAFTVERMVGGIRDVLVQVTHS